MNQKYTQEIIKIIKEYYPKFGYKKCSEITKLNKMEIQYLTQRYDIHRLFLDDKYIGKAFGRLTIIKKGKSVGYNKKWLCHCSCGNEKEVFYTNLQNGDIQSCGCLHRENASRQSFKDITGQKFNRLLVLNCASKNKRGSYLWNCQCDCGSLKIVDGNCLRMGRVRSCGCLLKEYLKYARGKNHHYYNPSISDEERSKRREYGDFSVDRQWRMKILKRDNFTCVVSGIKGKPLEAHHIFNFADHPNLRYDLNNGITMTKQLHRLFHHLYSIKYNTREQFDEFCKRYKSGEFAS